VRVGRLTLMIRDWRASASVAGFVLVRAIPIPPMPSLAATISLHSIEARHHGRTSILAAARAEVLFREIWRSDPDRVEDC